MLIRWAFEQGNMPVVLSMTGCSGSPYRQGDAQVSYEQVHDRAPKQVHGGRNLVGIVTYQGGCAVLVINLEAGGALEQLQNALDCRDVVCGMAEEDHVVCVQRDDGDRASGV